MAKEGSFTDSAQSSRDVSSSGERNAGYTRCYVPPFARCPSFRWAQNRHWAVSARISLEWLVAGLCVRLFPGAAHIESSVYLAEAEIDHG